MHLLARMPALAGFAVAATLVVTSPLLAETVKLGAKLDGSQETPKINTNGKGMAQVTYDTQSRKLNWTVVYSGLSGRPIGAHFHGPADMGKSAAVVVPLAGKLASPIKGSATLTTAQASDLLAGRYYINIHTPAHEDGEIRGQVEKGM
jgi:hypothetical protein